MARTALVSAKDRVAGLLDPVHHRGWVATEGSSQLGLPERQDSVCEFSTCSTWFLISSYQSFSILLWGRKGCDRRWCYCGSARGGVVSIG